MSSSSDAKARLDALIAKRDEMERELVSVDQALASHGISSEDKLIDGAGFPRADVDLVAIRTLRHRQIYVRNDLRQLMTEIEAGLVEWHALERAERPDAFASSSAAAPSSASQSNGRQGSSATAAAAASASTVAAASSAPERAADVRDTGDAHVDDAAGLRAFADVDEVMHEGPASVSGLRVGDLLVRFGSVSLATSDRPLADVATHVRAQLGREIGVVVRRGAELVRLTLVPKPWQGPGVLGCHLRPL